MPLCNDSYYFFFLVLVLNFVAVVTFHTLDKEKKNVQSFFTLSSSKWVEYTSPGVPYAIRVYSVIFGCVRVYSGVFGCIRVYSGVLGCLRALTILPIELDTVNHFDLYRFKRKKSRIPPLKSRVNYNSFIIIIFFSPLFNDDYSDWFNVILILRSLFEKVMKKMFGYKNTSVLNSIRNNNTVSIEFVSYFFFFFTSTTCSDQKKKKIKIYRLRKCCS